MARGRGGAGRGRTTGRHIGAGRHHGIGRHHHGIGHHHHFGIGRHRGVGHRHHFGMHRNRLHFGLFSHHRYHHGYSYHSNNAGRDAQYIIDQIAQTSAPPQFNNGVFSFIGNHMAALNFMDNYNALEYNYRMYAPMAPPTYEANLTIVGNKTAAANHCCELLTFILGALLILPLFCMCCLWWKKIVYPKYQVNPQTYRAISRMVKSNPNLKSLNLVVVDSNFDHNKAALVYDILVGSSISAFTFQNMALDCDYDGREATDFQENMMPLKQLPLQSQITWGDMTL